MSEILHQWDQLDQPSESVTLEEMDAQIQKLWELREEADKLEKIAKAAKDEFNTQKELVLSTLLASKKDSYGLDGVATVYVSRKETYRVPKTNEDKNALFNYIKKQYGPDALMGMVGIHSATLTAWANEESEKGVMQIPGLEAPTMVETLNIRKK